MKFSYQQEDSKSSSEETDQSEQNYNDSLIAGTGRSYYECVFCKRGFTTAQALGGHMNIHRKDKAKNKPNSSSTKVIDSDLRFYSAIESHPAAGNYYYATAPDDQVQVYMNYHPIYFGPPTWALRSTSQLTQCAEVLCVENRQVGDLFGEEYWRKGLSFYTNIPLCVNHETKGKLAQDSSEEDDGLDLELRLGYI